MKIPVTASVSAAAMVLSMPSAVAAGIAPEGKPIPVRTYQVTQKFVQFNPTDLAIKTGDTVVWTNKETDDTTHSVVQDNGDEIDSPDIPPGDTFTWKFDFPGEWDIVCRFHPGMFLNIHVAGKAVTGAKRPTAQLHHNQAPPAAKPNDPDGSSVPGVTGLPIATRPRSQVRTHKD